MPARGAPAISNMRRLITQSSFGRAVARPHSSFVGALKLLTASAVQSEPLEIRYLAKGVSYTQPQIGTNRHEQLLLPGERAAV